MELKERIIDILYDYLGDKVDERDLLVTAVEEAFGGESVFRGVEEPRRRPSVVLDSLCAVYCTEGCTTSAKCSNEKCVLKEVASDTKLIELFDRPTELTVSFDRKYVGSGMQF